MSNKNLVVIISLHFFTFCLYISHIKFYGKKKHDDLHAHRLCFRSVDHYAYLPTHLHARSPDRGLLVSIKNNGAIMNKIIKCKILG